MRPRIGGLFPNSIMDRWNSSNFLQPFEKRLLPSLPFTEQDLKKNSLQNVVPLYLACRSGDIKVIELLLNDSNIDVNETYEGVTPLYIACQQGHTEVVNILLSDPRIDVNKSNNEDETPIFISCWKQHLDIVKLLLNDSRTDVNQSNKNNLTPFYISCRIGSTEIVKLLLNDQRTEIEKASDQDITPFAVACLGGHLEIVKRILASTKRVAFKRKNSNGLTVLEQVRSHSTDSFEDLEDWENWETKNDAERTKCNEVTSLLEDYDRDPIGLKFELKKQFALIGNFFFFFS